MTRGNQREKAREKNLKDAAGSVSATSSTTSALEFDAPNMRLATSEGKH